MNVLSSTGFAAIVFMLTLGSGACSSSPQDSHEPSADNAAASSGLTRKLWVLNQNGDPAVAQFFQCVLGNNTNWNDIANTYPDGESMVFGGQVQRNDNPCTGGVGSAGFYQCAVNAGHFNLTTSDVLLVIIPDNGYGGQNGRTTVRNPVTGQSISINTAFVRTSPDAMYQTIYGGHEVFEAQTDGVSGDCCDGETSSGGPFPWCASCGPYNGGTGACGKYAPGGTVGTLGIDTIACGGRTFKYQRLSPHAHEFDGTCLAVTPKAPSGGWNCANSAYGGHQYWTCSGGSLHECDGSNHALTRGCNNLGCKVNAAGTNDQCFQASPAWSCNSSQGTDGHQYWTCSGDQNIHKCVGTTAIELACVRGCQGNAQNTDDACK